MAMRRSPVESGERDQIITIQQRPSTDAVDTSGAPVDGPWTTLVASMPAARIDIQGREWFVADQLSARYDVRWEMNYRADIDPNLVDVAKLRRVIHQGRQYDVVAGSVIGRKEGVELMTLTGNRQA